MARQASTNVAGLPSLDSVRVMMRDRDGTIRVWTKSMTRLYGYTAEEAVGRKAHDLLRTVFPKPLSFIAGVLERNGEWSGELLNHRKDGTAVAVAAYCAVVPGEKPEQIAETN